jgi:preprotein translocase subunit SecF
MIIKFSKHRNLFFLLSALLGIFLAVYTYQVHGSFAKSISFNGGIRISLVLPEGMTREDLEKASAKIGFENPSVRMTSVRSNQYDLEYGPKVRDDIEKKLKEHDAVKAEGSAATEIENALIGAIPGLTRDNIVSRETISASYGGELYSIAIWSFVFTILMISLYLSFRFDFPYALGATLALVHDTVLTVAFIGAAQIEPSIPVVAAVLTIVGYSINDTIVIFDRIREKMNDQPMLSAAKSTMDGAITETLSRTVMTSFLTLLSVVALIIGGAQSLYDFAYVLIFGIVVGTYSSIFIASHFVQIYMEVMGRVTRRKA